jgi:hypothetical protein
VRDKENIYINGCRYNERLNAKTEGSKRLTYAGVERVEIIVSLATGLVVTTEVRDLVRRERNQRTAREREECGCGKSGGLYVMYMCE